ncbi:3-deoxy-D-manno-octulosonic acid transferase [Loktanella sp. TSTF-M6]|uniref:3-deoxy-D-manno-octulosonic acid transferase n=1 Tax=Loktanella gaetbuli TaxID=2881335 RepID=A0ABS8BRL7_9RHOB|nr:3-deoxy-D-manno-octulosonic acid transferase [Loktanella gaetbuli]MCB5198181.1 3-deoxy-D-manno-octulosonic acid transferase [Loktanella gaetbuli]
MRPPLLLRAYAGFASLAVPVLQRRLIHKLTDQGVTNARARERTGHATQPRPDSTLIWFHGASVGETLSILPLIDALHAQRADLTVLVTSGTATSAEILARRLPARAIHQFAPLDSPAVMRRFHAQWRPDLAVLIESEFWPNMIRSCADRAVPLVLLNARLSDRSVKRWRQLGAPARWLLDQFALIVAQTEATAQNLRSLGAARVQVGANLKAAAPPAPDNPALRAEMETALAGRHRWLAASTHAGEDAPLLDAHAALRQQHPDLCLILAPRHPDRADEIATLARQRGLTVTRRSAGDAPTADVYLADTLGEMGTWYRLSPVTFIAGSFGDAGGHNPWEACTGTAILHGPKVANCAADYATLNGAGGARAVTPDTLAWSVNDLLTGNAAQAMATAAIACKQAQGDGTADLARRLLSLTKDHAP